MAKVSGADTSYERLVDEVQGVTKAHIERMGFCVRVEPYVDGLLLQILNGSAPHHEEHISLVGIPASLQGEYVHCRVHAVAATLISQRHPLR